MMTEMEKAKKDLLHFVRTAQEDMVIVEEKVYTLEEMKRKGNFTLPLLKEVREKAKGLEVLRRRVENEMGV